MVITELWRYPVKSMQGELVESVHCDASGFEGDRRWGVVTPDGYVLSGKSEPRILEASASTRAGGEIDLTLPHGVRTASDDPDVDAYLSAWLDRPVRLHRAAADDQFTIHHQLDVDDPSKTKDFPTPKGAYYDSRSTLHLLSDASLRAAKALYPTGEWEVRRFRPNLVVALEGDDFAEESWVERTVLLGGVEALVRKLTDRCVLTTRGQPGLRRDLEIYKTLSRHNESVLGIYLVAQTAGLIAVGDKLSFK